MKCCTILLVVALINVGLRDVYANTGRFLRAEDVIAYSRVPRAAPSSPADVMARNILEWIQGIYRQGTRKTRQQPDSNAYLPPYNGQRLPEKPRPFQPATTPQPPYYSSPSQNSVTDYQSYPKPSSSYTPPNVGYSPSSPQRPGPSFSTPKPTYVPPTQGFGNSPSYRPQPSGPSGPPASSTFPPLVGSPGRSTVYIPPANGGYPVTTLRPAPAPSAGRPTTDSYGYPTQRPSPGFPTPNGGANRPAGQANTNDGYPVSTPAPSPPFPLPGGSPGDDQGGTSNDVNIGGEGTGSTGQAVAGGTDDDDLKHPPHIHRIDVECGKSMMTITIEFNREFNGVIYSKGFYTNPECRYVEQNSGKTEYSFTVSLDSCGTQFISDFEGEGQAYLENVLVLQNEPGIQEVWDTVRRVRCLWEGNINKALSISLAVDMLNQEVVTFSGDTASAKLDIQIGKGPFAPTASGLVKIGETMTLVVSVEGDPDFDLQVRDCIARDETSTNVLMLTDERGCILKPKLFGAFQKTNDTGNTGATQIAYAYFQAFKFPDIMDLFIECNVELCKTNCQPCPDPDQQIEPGRRRRRRSVGYVPMNTTAVLLADPIRVAGGFRVIMLDDLSTASGQIDADVDNAGVMALKAIVKDTNVCMSNSGFYAAFSLMLSTLVVSTISAAVLYIKLQKVYKTKYTNS